MSDNNQPPSRSSPTLPRGLVSRRGGIVNPSARMPSLRSPRDLTLGGRPKKSFKPNIPVRKERSRDEPKDNSNASSSSSSSTSKEKEGKSSRDGSNRGRGRGRGRGGRRQLETIQTHSIFEQGPMEKSKGRGASVSSYGGSGEPSFSRQSAGSKKISIKNEDPHMIEDLLRDDFVDLSTMSKDDERYNPVQLPLAALLPKKEIKEKKEEEEKESKMEVEEEKDVKMDVDVKVKSEPPDTDVEMKEFVKPAPVPEKVKPPIKSKLPSKKDKTTERVTCSSLFASDRYEPDGELIFFQLPDTLPGFPSGKEEEDRKPVIIKQEKDVAGSSQQQQQQKESQESDSKNCSLHDLPEGYLGKLQVMKSGKTRLLLGNIKLDVSMGSPCGFLQDLVSVKLGGEKGGELITLGHISHRVVCTPDFEQLLHLGS